MASIKWSKHLHFFRIPVCTYQIVRSTCAWSCDGRGVKYPSPDDERSSQMDEGFCECMIEEHPTRNGYLINMQVKTKTTNQVLN